MYRHKYVLLLLIACCCCSWSSSSVVVPRGPLRSYITGGFKAIQTRSSKAVVDCNQYTNDYEVLYYFPFLVMINPMSYQWEKTTAEMDGTDTFVTSIYLREVNGSVPESLFCLKRLRYLSIEKMNFIDDVVPDTLINLKQLTSLQIHNTRINNMTDELARLRSLNTLVLNSCSLLRLPSFDGLENLYQYLYLDNNLFTHLPIITGSENLYTLYIASNPLKHVMSLNLFANLQNLDLRNTTISSIPPTIDKLQNLYNLDISNNKLVYLPKNIIKLAKLRYLHLRGNLFATDELATIQRQFNASIPNCTLYV